MKKKVIFLIGTLSDGGAERVVSNLSLELTDQIEREIILFGENSRTDYKYNGNILYLDRDNSKGIFAKISTFFKRLYKLNKIKNKNPNVPVISFLEYPNLLNMLTVSTKNSMVSVRNFMSTKHKKGIKALFWNISIKLLYRRARRIIAVSEAINKDLTNNYGLNPKNIRIVNNFYSVHKIQKLSEEQLSQKERIIFDKPTIISVGRLNKQKGQHHLIKSFALVKEKILDAQLVILGSGQLKNSLLDLAAIHGVADSVHLWEFQENPFKYIAKSKVFVMTSYYEGFPNALAEAMACDTPVISTDCLSGPREILAPNDCEYEIDYSLNTERNGLIVPVFDKVNDSEVERQIASHIFEIVTNVKAYNFWAEKSSERIKDFDSKKVISIWEEIIIDHPDKS